MKKAIIVFLLLTIMITAGCTNQSAQPNPPSVPVPTTISPAPTILALPSVVVPLEPAPSSTETKPPVVVDRDKINRNFINIAFGKATTHLTKWDDPVVKIGISGDYRDADYTLLETFLDDFNSVSSSTHGTLYKDANQPVTLILVPESLLRQIMYDPDMKDSIDGQMVVPSTGDILLIHRTITDELFYKERIYINSESGEYREHCILLGVLTALGFPGYSEETDSIFYPVLATNNRTILSSNDWLAVEMMYNMGFKRNDTLNQVNSKLIS